MVSRQPAVIRVAVPEDASMVVRMYEWLFESPGRRPAGLDDESLTAAFRRVTVSAEAAVLVGQQGDEGIGLCSVYLDIESIRYGRRAWVEDLAVHPGHRSRGIGKLLLDEAKGWARARGATHLELESAPARLDAHRFYERELPSTRAVCFGWKL